jgi:hypothetical protein
MRLMETIRNYLETMFAGFPKTTEVERAKSELYQMMEDKYTELNGEGKTESEILGIIISEFGNLDELAEEFGIKLNTKVKKEKPKKEVRFYNISLDDAKKYITQSMVASFRNALAVALLVLSAVPLWIGESVNKEYDVRTAENYIGLVIQILMVVSGIALFIWNRIKIKNWQHIEEGICRLDDGVYIWLSEHRDNTKFIRNVSSYVGIALCIISVLPMIFFGGTDLVDNINQEKLTNIVSVCITAVGIFILMFNIYMHITYKNIMVWEYTNEESNVKTIHYKNYFLETVMSSYWETVFTIYLCISFITYIWNITWIIIPIAWIINVLVDKFFGKECSI